MAEPSGSPSGLAKPPPSWIFKFPKF